MLYKKSLYKKVSIIVWIMMFNSYLFCSMVDWPRVEQGTQNTVVQVWSQGAKKSWLEPYKTPQQHQGVGTAFFINSNGDMLTNFHVIDQANFIYIYVPSGGRKPYEVKVKGVCPEQDVALLELTDDSRAELMKLLGSIPYLTLGDSDMLVRAEPVMALGYPLGSRYLKSTLGEIAGYDYLYGSSYIHITAPLNPGNSGGPLLNRFGEVVGINSAGIILSQNISWIIPINDASSILKQLYAKPLYKKPKLDFGYNPATEEHARFLNCPTPGGIYINKVLSGSSSEMMGVKIGDMLYQIIWKGTTYDIDEYGDVKVGWRSSDKIALRELMIRFMVDDPLDLIIYRKGERLKLSINLNELPKYPARYICFNLEPWEMDYEILFGVVFMQLRQNHIIEFAENEELKNPKQKKRDTAKFDKYLSDPSKEAILMTHIHNGSPLQKLQCFAPGDIIEEINGKKVNTLNELQQALLESVQTGYISLSTKKGCATALSLDKVLSEEPRLASDFGYPLTDIYKKLKNLRSMNPR